MVMPTYGWVWASEKCLARSVRLLVRTWHLKTLGVKVIGI